MLPDILSLFYLLWPVTVGSIIVFFVCGLFLAINIGSFVFGFLIIFYYIYNFLKRKGVFSLLYDWLSSKSSKMNSTLHQNVRDTFLVKGKLDNIPTSPVLYIAHPHGLFSMAAFLHWAARVTEWPAEHRVRIAVHSIFFKIPLVCELMEHFGAIEATEEEIMRVLKEGESVALLTGGIRELIETHPGKMTVVLKKRTGFLRIARELQLPIVPVLTFGENELFPPLRSSWMRGVQKYLRSWFGIALPVPTFSSIVNWFSLLQAPLRPTINTWVGEAIVPGKESIDELQKKVFLLFETLYKEGKPADYPEVLEIL